MKKLLFVSAISALVLVSSCSNKVSDNPLVSSAEADSIANLFGLVVGSSLNENMRTNPDLNKKDFLRGLAAAVMSDTADMSYQQGLQMGSRIVGNFNYFNKEMGLSIDRDAFMRQLKTAFLSDTVRSYSTEQAIFNSMMEGLQKRVQERKDEVIRQSPEAVANRAAAEAFMDSLKKADPEIITTESGLSYKVLAQGEGENVDINDRASVIYKGSFIDGTVFDQSRDEKPSKFSPRGVVPGFGEGLQLMNPGSHYILYIPGELGYGVNGQPGAQIGPDQMLIFDVEVQSIDGK